jgi:D-lyxose ketol-isomerase
MKRSEINQAVRLAEETLREHQICLPPFGCWPPEKWKEAGDEYERVRANGLGWDISDFGGNDFRSFGTVQFTLRNGNHLRPSEGTPYAEKLIILIPGQRLPLHFHYTKTEDIINRGGGTLVMELFNSLPDGSVDRDSEVTVYCDGCRRHYGPGEVFVLEPGESITLVPRLHHLFRAGRDGGVLVLGEVSTVNDDLEHNFFAEPVSRFPDIEEDEPPVRLLCGDYRSGGRTTDG